jgi:hypothetical protein
MAPRALAAMIVVCRFAVARSCRESLLQPSHGDALHVARPLDLPTSWRRTRPERRFVADQFELRACPHRDDIDQRRILFHTTRFPLPLFNLHIVYHNGWWRRKEAWPVSRPSPTTVLERPPTLPHQRPSTHHGALLTTRQVHGMVG